jgi:tetratricopeptide (TPR) repeat protein
MKQSNLEELFRTAVTHHQAGQLQQAEQIYRQILTADQRHGPTWHLLGVLAHQAGRSDVAVQMITNAIQLGLGGDAYNNLGEALRTLGRHTEAASAYQTAIQQQPNNAEAMSNLGLIYNTVGKYSDAIPLLEKAVAIKPNLPNAHYNYGIALDNTGKLDDAIEQWEITLRLQPDHALAMNNVGVGLQRRDRLERAIATLRRLVEKYPTFAEGHANLGSALAQAGKYEEAITEAKKAIELEPRRPEALNTLGVVYMRAGRLDDAIAATLKAVEMNPRFHKAIGNIGGIYQKMERHDLAIEWFERASKVLPADVETANALYGAYYKIRQPEKSLEATENALKHNPNHPELHGNRSLALLALGNYIEGFEEYEWRWRCNTFTSPPRDFDRPMWENSDLNGRTLLVHAEQGYGDIIQFARYLPMVAEMGAKLIVEVPVAVRSLIETIPGVARVVPKGLKLPDFDLHIPLLSLPRAFKTTLQTIPNQVPYFRVDESRLEKWRPVIANNAKGKKIGLVWGGNLKPDPKRSVRLKELAPLADVPDIAWFSLQTGDPRDELKESPPGMNIVDIGKDLKEFADTAALMSLLDMVITIDTASAHLAGAMAVKTWTIIPHAADWRWQMEGEQSPWYPTMRLFRQSVANDWGPTIARIRDELLNQR